MPRKVLISSAYRMDDIQHAKEDTLIVDVKIDASQIMTNVHQ